MDLSTFENKLKQLNPRLKLDGNGIYLTEYIDDEIDARGLGWELYSSARHLNERNMEYIGWVKGPEVYAGDTFTFDGNTLCTGWDTKNDRPLNYKNNEFLGARQWSLGWRTVCKRLLAKHATTPEKARKVFGYEESSYDRKNYEQKLEFFKKYGM